MKEAVQRKLESWLEEKEEIFVKDIASLVQIPSIAEKKSRKGAPYGENCRTVLEVMQKIARREKVETDDVDGYCLRLTVGEGETEIGIWNHLDVVPAGEGWTYPPFACTIKNGYLIGRGVQDNKGPAMAVFYAVCFCREQGLLKHIRVSQILGCQEETGMTDVAYYLSHRHVPEISFVADCGFPVCCGEKGILRVVLETSENVEGVENLRGGTVCNSVPAYAEIQLKGANHVLSANGISGHAAFPDGTCNAVGILISGLKEFDLPEKTEKMLKFLGVLAADGYGEAAGISCEDSISGKLTCNLGVVFMKEGKLRAEVDIRYPVSMHQDDFLPKLLKLAEKAGFVPVEVRDDPPYYMEKNHPFVKVLMDAWKESSGRAGEPFVMGGGTYARKIPNAVAFGPGQPRDFRIPGLPDGHGNGHCADEAEAAENLKNAVKIYVEALIRVDQWIGKQKENKFL